MKKLVLFLLLTSPLFALAQVNDMYYVPKKEKKVLVVKSAEEIYFADDNNLVVDGEFNLENRFGFTYADEFVGEWEFVEDGVPLPKAGVSFQQGTKPGEIELRNVRMNGKPVTQL